MSPDILIEDFERTENSDYLHSVIGRCLIIATRFDNACTVYAKATELKVGLPSLLSTDDSYDKLVLQIEKKYRTLNDSIKSEVVPIAWTA
jgi:SPX domain protein involved in polyphosphate accumulation